MIKSDTFVRRDAAFLAGSYRVLRNHIAVGGDFLSRLHCRLLRLVLVVFVGRVRRQRYGDAAAIVTARGSAVAGPAAAAASAPEGSSAQHESSYHAEYHARQLLNFVINDL